MLLTSGGNDPTTHGIPDSYITTAGVGHPATPGASSPGLPSGLLPSSQSARQGLARRSCICRLASKPLLHGCSHTTAIPLSTFCSLHSLESDPVLTFISTRLGTANQRHGSRSTTDSTVLSSTSGSTGSGLPPEMQQWAVEWGHIHLERQIGRGSFGAPGHRVPAARLLQLGMTQWVVVWPLCSLAGRVYLASWNATPVAGEVECQQAQEGCQQVHFAGTHRTLPSTSIT